MNNTIKVLFYFNTCIHMLFCIHIISVCYSCILYTHISVCYSTKQVPSDHLK